MHSKFGPDSCQTGISWVLFYSTILSLVPVVPPVFLQDRSCLTIRTTGTLCQPPWYHVPVPPVSRDLGCMVKTVVPRGADVDKAREGEAGGVQHRKGEVWGALMAIISQSVQLKKQRWRRRPSPPSCSLIHKNSHPSVTQVEGACQFCLLACWSSPRLTNHDPPSVSTATISVCLILHIQHLHCASL